MLFFGTLSLMCLCLYSFVYGLFPLETFPGIAANKTCAFFLCNGILALVLGTSGLMKSSEARGRRMLYASVAASSDVSVREKDESAEVGKEGVVAAENDDGDDEKEEKDEMGKLSVEELNRKCDDFIKEMKGGIVADHALLAG